MSEKKKSNRVEIDFGDGKEEVEYTEIVFSYILVVLILMSSFVAIHEIFRVIL